MRLLLAILLSFFVLRTTRALPIAICGRYVPSNLIGREIHNADFNNAGMPPQTVNSGSSSQGSGVPNEAQHPSPGTQAKPGSPQQQNSGQPNSPPNVKAARSESHVDHQTIKSRDRRHSVKAGAQGVPKHGHGSHASGNHHHSTTISSRKVTHQDSYLGDENQATPPPPTTSSNAPESLSMMGIMSPSLSDRYETPGAGINNVGDEKSVSGDGPLSKEIKMNKGVADDGAFTSPPFDATHQAV